MLIYKDIISGDELFSDTYPISLVDDVMYRVVGKYVTEKAGDYDAAIGANPSAEEACEGVDDGSIYGINVVVANRLLPTPIDKKSYMTYIKAYMAKIKSKLEEDNPDRAKVFVEKIPPQVKKIISEFKEYEFFTGETMNPEGMIVLLKYEDNAEGNEEPILYFFKDGLDEEKV